MADPVAPSDVIDIEGGGGDAEPGREAEWVGSTTLGADTVPEANNRLAASKNTINRIAGTVTHEMCCIDHGLSTSYGLMGYKPTLYHSSVKPVRAENRPKA
jgi:hypothetical protein